jgi:heme a synthase
LVVLLLQILLGGWTSANYAALVCHELPLCEAGWQQRFSLSAAVNLPLNHETYEYGVMPYEARMTIHVLHRIGALVTLLVLGSFAFLAWRRAGNAEVRKLAILLAGLVLTQVGLGLINVIALLPLVNAVAHNFVAANLFAVMLLWVYQLHRQPAQQPLVATPNMQLLGGRYGN